MSSSARIHHITPLQRQSVARTLRNPSCLKTAVLGALVVGLALIPEAIAFSVIAGVDPQVGLFAAAALFGAVSDLASPEPPVTDGAHGSLDSLRPVRGRAAPAPVGWRMNDGGAPDAGQ